MIHSFVAAAGATFIVSIVVWFWPHCARPALTSRGAGPVTAGLVFTLSALLIAGQIGEAILVIAGVGFFIPLWAVSSIPWLVVVAIGYLVDEYATLVRLTGRR